MIDNTLNRGCINPKPRAIDSQFDVDFLVDRSAFVVSVDVEMAVWVLILLLPPVLLCWASMMYAATARASGRETEAYCSCEYAASEEGSR